MEEGVLNSAGGRGNGLAACRPRRDPVNRPTRRIPGGELTRGRERLDGEKKSELLPAGNLLDVTKSV